MIHGVRTGRAKQRRRRLRDVRGLCHAVAVTNEEEQCDRDRLPQTVTGAVRRSASIVTRRVDDDEEIALSVSGDQVVELRGTAFALWQVIQGESGLDYVIEQLATAYGVDAAAIADDVNSGVDDLVAAGILERVGT
jgi:hypothetical protein